MRGNNRRGTAATLAPAAMDSAGEEATIEHASRNQEVADIRPQHYSMDLFPVRVFQARIGFHFSAESGGEK